jgi:hypothetical protein
MKIYENIIVKRQLRRNEADANEKVPKHGSKAMMLPMTRCETSRENSFSAVRRYPRTWWLANYTSATSRQSALLQSPTYVVAQCVWSTNIECMRKRHQDSETLFFLFYVFDRVFRVCENILVGKCELSAFHCAKLQESQQQ